MNTNAIGRPTALRGHTYAIESPSGSVYVTINEIEKHVPFEIFVTSSKCGSDVMAYSEALARLITMILQIKDEDTTPLQRIALISEQLDMIGGEESVGFGPNRVRSIPDAVAKVFGDYIEDIEMGEM